MLVAFELASNLAILGAGRNPTFSEQTTFNGAPTLAVAGTDIEDILEVLALVVMREDVSYRTGRVSFPAVVAGSTFTVTVGGNAVAYVAAPGDDDAAVIAGLIAALVGVPAADALVSFAAGSQGATNQLVVTGDAEADYTIDIAATGASTIACAADPTNADCRLWLVGGGTGAPVGWQMAQNSEYAITFRGLAERYDVAGFEAAYLEVNPTGVGDGSAVTYVPRVYVGPCGEET